MTATNVPLPRALNLIDGKWVPAASGKEMDVRLTVDGIWSEPCFTADLDQAKVGFKIPCLARDRLCFTCVNLRRGELMDTVTGDEILTRARACVAKTPG